MNAVKPIPESYPRVSPHLSIAGVGEALEFYCGVLGASVRMRMDGILVNVAKVPVKLTVTIRWLGLPPNKDGFRGWYRDYTVGLDSKPRAGLFDNTGLRGQSPLHLPDTADPVAGMHYPRSTVWQAVRAAAQTPQPWRSWVCDELRMACPRPPAVIGVSLMGPSQVFVGLLVLAVTVTVVATQLQVARFRLRHTSVI
jgi:hypothetical protein